MTETSVVDRTPLNKLRINIHPNKIKTILSISVEFNLSKKYKKFHVQIIHILELSLPFLLPINLFWSLGVIWTL
jgi:hypothetical protein